MLNKYIVTVQELHEKRYLVSNAVAPQQAQEWVENMEYGLSDMIANNIQDMDDDTRFITDGRNNIVENLRDINIKKVTDKDLPYHLRNNNWNMGNNTEWIKNNNMGCTCGYDEEETRYHEQETCCPDDKCECNS